MIHRSMLLALVPALAMLSATAEALTLAETITAATERHPRINEAAALQSVADGYRRQADSLVSGDPSLDLGAAGDRFGSDFGYEEYVAGVSVPVWLPGQRKARRQVAERLGAEADRQLTLLRWQITGEVLDRAWALRIAEAEAAQAAKQWEAAIALEKDITRRFDAGELTRNDLLLAQQDVIDTEAAFRASENQVVQVRLAWSSLTGMETLPDDLDAFARSSGNPVFEQHPRLLAAKARTETAQARARNVRAQRRASPTVGLYAKHDRGIRGDEYTDSLGLELSLPFGSHRQAAPAIAEAEAELLRQRADAALVERELKLALEQAEQAVARSKQQLALAQKKHGYAQDRLRLAQRAFELGEMGLYQLLLARQQAARAERELELRQLELLRDLAKQHHALGVIPQ